MEYACQVAARKTSQDPSDSTARWAGTSPVWELVPQLQSKGKRAGSEQGHRLRMAGQGHGDGDELKPGWDISPWVVIRVRNGEVGGSGGICCLAQARPRARASASKHNPSKNREDLTSLSKLQVALPLGYSAAPDWTPAQAKLQQVAGWGEVCTQGDFEMLRC